MTIKAFISGCEGISLSKSEKEFFARENPWGLILFKRNCETPDQLRALTSSFRTAVGRKDAPVFIDQEGGRVQRMGPPSNFWRKYPAARAYGELYERCPMLAMRTARNVGRLMAEDLFDVGITADCLPVLDLPQLGAHDVIGNRAYSTRIEHLTIVARAHVSGLMEGGVMPVMKHIPGHGRSEVDSHHNLPVVTASRGDLEQTDFQPFAALADLPMAMTAHVIFTALDKTAPATLSRKVINGAIRKDIGFRGLLMTDDLSMKALSGTLPEKAEAAYAAGCDMLLHCNGIMSEMEQVAASAIPLKGKPMQRAKSALRSRRKPLPFDRKVALQHWEALMTS